MEKRTRKIENNVFYSTSYEWFVMYSDSKSESINYLDNWMWGCIQEVYWTLWGHFNYFCDLLLTGTLPESQQSCLPELWEIVGCELQVSHINHFWGFVSWVFTPWSFYPKQEAVTCQPCMTINIPSAQRLRYLYPPHPGYILKIKNIVIQD